MIKIFALIYVISAILMFISQSFMILHILYVLKKESPINEVFKNTYTIIAPILIISIIPLLNTCGAFHMFFHYRAMFNDLLTKFD